MFTHVFLFNGENIPFRTFEEYINLYPEELTYKIDTIYLKNPTETARKMVVEDKVKRLNERKYYFLECDPIKNPL